MCFIRIHHILFREKKIVYNIWFKESDSHTCFCSTYVDILVHLRSILAYFGAKEVHFKVNDKDLRLERAKEETSILCSDPKICSRKGRKPNLEAWRKWIMVTIFKIWCLHAKLCTHRGFQIPCIPYAGCSESCLICQPHLLN